MRADCRVAITGSDGYVGNFLCEFLSDKGFSVVGIDLHSSRRQSCFLNFKFVCCDVRDKEKLKQIFCDEKITHVIHLAYLMDAQHDRAFEDDIDINGSVSVFVAANETLSVRQFVHFSSASIYGARKSNLLWICEDFPLRPRDWVYAQNKKKVEEFLFGFKKRDCLKLVNLRMCTAVGPSYYKKGGVVRMLYSSPFLLLLDGCDVLLQFVHEDDVKRVVELVLCDDSVEGIFNLAPDSFASSRELVPHKFFLKFPKKLFRLIVSILWFLRVSSVSPTAVALVAYSIVISPKKLVDRYGFVFEYSTKSAFDDAVRKRLLNHTL